jgi:hypothetical protein
MEKERDTKTSLLNFIERAKNNFFPLQRTDILLIIINKKEKNRASAIWTNATWAGLTRGNKWPKHRAHSFSKP